jgi:uncharacterized LabA/DUF88 family protein
MNDVPARTNCAFIDSQNLNLGVLRLGWKLDFKRFRIYLHEKYGVRRAYLFLGFLPENQSMYRALQEYGYVLVFKPVLRGEHGRVKGNCDAELVLQAMVDIHEYDQAVIVTSDGDYGCLVHYLREKGKLCVVLSPSREHCSALLRKAARDKLMYFDTLRGKLEHRGKLSGDSERAPPRDETRGSAPS